MWSDGMKNNIKTSIRKFFKTSEGTLFIIFLFVFALMSVLSPGKFLSPINMESMAYQIPEFGILALSMMLVIMTGGMNLSLTFSAALGMIIGGLVMSNLYTTNHGALLAVTVGIATMLGIAALCGLFNGWVIALFGVTPMIATLGSSTLFEGICLNITHGGAISGFPMAFILIGNSTFLKIPIPMWIFFAVVVFCWLLLERSKLGKSIEIIGCNPIAARYSGIRVKRVLIKTYLIGGILAGIAAMIMASRYNSAKESYGSSYLLQSVAACVLGGTDINGGSGKVAGTIIAVLILQVISSGLNIFGLNRYLTTVITGLVLIAVLTIHFIISIKKRNVQ